MDNQLVSIIMPVFNAQEFLQESIESVRNQSYPDWELLAVDDCSQDDSLKILQEVALQDARIKVIQLDQNQGAAVARNAGLQRAKGRYLAFIDSDDRWHFDKLERQLDFMISNQYAFSYTNFSFMDESGQMIKSRVDLPEKLDYHGLLKETAIACSTVMLDRKKIKDFQMPLVRKGQDTATWLMLMRTRKVSAYGLDVVLNDYRQVKGSISSNKWQALKRTWHTYRHLEQLPLIPCCYYFCQYVLHAILRRI